MNSADLQATRDRAVQWMNRGHALLVRDGGMEALVAYAYAITLLRTLPVAENPAWANSLGAALMNHGQLLHRVHGLGRADDALNAYSDAIALLSVISPAEIPWARRNLAGTLLNRANLFLDLSRFADACVDARLSLAAVVGVERDDLVDAELALKARRALCDALGQLIGVTNASGQDQLATEAGDVVDEALALARHWAARGENSFAPLVVRFFRFGAGLYRRHQLHFLAEFLAENLEAAPAHADELDAIARTALDSALADGTAPARFTLGDTVSERALHTHRELAAARARLAPPSLVA